MITKFYLLELERFIRAFVRQFDSRTNFVFYKINHFSTEMFLHFILRTGFNDALIKRKADPDFIYSLEHFDCSAETIISFVVSTTIYKDRIKRVTESFENKNSHQKLFIRTEPNQTKAILNNRQSKKA